MSEITALIEAMGKGEPNAADKLLSVVYDELRRLAASKMASELPGQTLQPTALVHEVWLRLFGSEPPKFEGRGHFFGIAAEAMRRILIERARQKKSLKRGAGAPRINLDDVDVAATADDESLLMVDEALQKLKMEDSEAAQFIHLRFFAGLTNAEAAAAMGLSERTARRHWTFARAWLYREIRKLETA